MTSKRVSVWYDDEGDMLEVMWAFREGYFTPTDDERTLTVKQAAPFGWASRNDECDN